MKYQLNRFLLLHTCSLLCMLMSAPSIIAQNRDISYLSSGGKLKPLQAIMDIRHYTIILDVDIDKNSIKGIT